MKISAVKLAANMANALKSTGPKTDEGKARVSQNAVRHGLCAKDLIIHAGEQEEFDEFQAELINDVRPCDSVEGMLFHQLVHAGWNLRRIGRLEAQLFDGTTDPLLDPDLRRKMDCFAVYRGRYERTFHRSLRELKALQTASVPRATLEASTRQRLPCLVDLGKVYKQTQKIASDATAKLESLAMEAAAGGETGDKAPWDAFEEMRKAGILAPEDEN